MAFSPLTLSTFEAEFSDTRDVVVTRRRWFGLGRPMHRSLQWDGDTCNPDFRLLAMDGDPMSTHIARHGALYRACHRALMISRGRLPMPWAEGPPPARLLKG